MTKKDYVRLAEAMRFAKPSDLVDWPNARMTQWTDDLEAIADALAADNGRFDRERFERACKGE